MAYSNGRYQVKNFTEDDINWWFRWSSFVVNYIYNELYWIVYQRLSSYEIEELFLESIRLPIADSCWPFFVCQTRKCIKVAVQTVSRHPECSGMIALGISCHFSSGLFWSQTLCRAQSTYFRFKFDPNASTFADFFSTLYFHSVWSLPLAENLMRCLPRGFCREVPGHLKINSQIESHSGVFSQCPADCPNTKKFSTQTFHSRSTPSDSSAGKRSESEFGQKVLVQVLVHAVLMLFKCSSNTRAQ